MAIRRNLFGSNFKEFEVADNKIPSESDSDEDFLKEIDFENCKSKSIASKHQQKTEYIKDENKLKTARPLSHRSTLLLSDLSREQAHETKEFFNGKHQTELDHISDSLTKIHSCQETVKFELENTRRSLASKARKVKSSYRLMLSEVKELASMIEFVHLLNEKVEIKSVGKIVKENFDEEGRKLL